MDFNAFRKTKVVILNTQANLGSWVLWIIYTQDAGHMDNNYDH